ncbi:MAG: hypothetical protein ABIL66_08840 [candidate division WOR-3 bacterium]
MNRETSGKGEKGRIRVNRGKEGEQNKPDKPERQDRPDGMVQYRLFGNCSIASLAEAKGVFLPKAKSQWLIAKKGG